MGKIIKWGVLTFLILTQVILFQNCGSEENNHSSSLNSQSVAEKANFDWINQNIIQPKCVECHHKSLAFGGYDFTTRAGVLEAVEPGDPAASPLYTRSFTTTFFVLSDGERSIIRTWILNGADQ